MHQKQTIWWLNPASLFCSMAIIVTLAAQLIPADLYAFLWGAPKYFNSVSSLLIAGSCVCFLCGERVAAIRPTGWLRASDNAERAPLHLQTLLLLYRVSVGLCLLGYAVWGAMAVRRGLNFGVLLSFFSGAHGVSEILRTKYLGNVTGVTTFTQFGVASSVLGGLIIRQAGWKRIRFSLAVVFGLGVARAFLNSERLAVIELAVPLLVIFVQFIWSPGAGIRVRRALKLLPAAGAVLLYFLFALFEYFRSWITYYAGNTEYSFWTFASCRLAGYYVTALNNGAFFLQRLDTPLRVPYFVLNFLWRFPLVKDVVDRLIGTPLNTDDYFEMLFRGANAEFNNADGYFVPMIDFGFYGGLLYWFLIGLICSLLYRMFRKGNAWGLCLYPFVFMGLIDIVRGIYWASGRAIPGALYLLLAALLLRLRQKRESVTAGVEPLNDHQLVGSM